MPSGVVTFENIKAFTIAELGDFQSGITERSALAHDFAIAGLDGKEFMDKYAARYGVNLDGFDWVAYFGPEASANPLGLIRYLWKRYVVGVPARELLDLPELTLGHLADCANRRKWFAPK